jgi:hypothetical protein
MTDIDLDSHIRDLLLGNPGLGGLVGPRIYASTDLPTGYTPDDGAAILFAARGGQGPDESELILWPSYQFRCYASTETLAREVDHALFRALSFARSNRIKMARLDVYPQVLRQQEPEPAWPFVLSYYQVIIGDLGD